jgi:hypothetical protein
VSENNTESNQVAEVREPNRSYGPILKTIPPLNGLPCGLSAPSRLTNEECNQAQDHPAADRMYSPPGRK